MKGKNEYDVCLISMPYAGVMRPSLALGILKQILADAGLKVKVICADLLFAEKVGLPMYTVCSHQFQVNMMVGEWTFAKSAFPQLKTDDDSYLDVVTSEHWRIMGYSKPDQKQVLREDLIKLREDASAFIDELAVLVNEVGAKIVGCTSTFEQNVASLALLRQLKVLNPSVKTMMGGANCEGDMGAALHRNYPWIDYIVSGEADGIIASLCKNILDVDQIPIEDLPKGVRGPSHRKDAMASFQKLPRITFNALSELPVPDFRDYFVTLQQLSIAKHISPGIPIETSRGCWWGAIHHCTFCGLNGTSMSFRSKSPEKVLREIETLEANYNNSKFEVVDNIIDMKYLKTVTPELAKSEKKRTFFYEVKSNLSRKQVYQLKEAGITWVQPGIESLHTEVLNVIDKGTKGWQNIQLLKWARECGVRLSWSILWDFPDEKDEWYVEMLDWIPLLEHLQAPGGLIPLRYDRYSVYHSKPEKWNLKLRPMSAMHYVYGLPEHELMDLTYFFVQEGGYDPFGLAGNNKKAALNRPGLRKFLALVELWTKRFWSRPKPILSLTENGDNVVIIDTRSQAKEYNITLRGLDMQVLLICDEAPMMSQIVRLVNEKYAIDATDEMVSDSIAYLKELRLVLALDERLVALPVRGNLPALPRREDFPGGALNYGSDYKSEIGKLDKIETRNLGPEELVAKKQIVEFSQPLILDSGKILPKYQVSYQSYGTLSPSKDNAILVFHSFTKDDHLAGKYNAEDKKAGWWDAMVGPGKVLDTNKYFVLCANVLGGCGGSTGPASIDPMTGKVYAMNFPMITIGDMIKVQKNLIDHLDIDKLACIVGGCFGGAQALEWLIRYPESTIKAVMVAITPATSAHTVAISKVMRDMICNDANWNNGDYYGKTFPEQGLINGILVGVPIWMSRAAMQSRFGRKKLNNSEEMSFESHFLVEKFMEQMAAEAKHELDPNSLLYMSRAVEYFDLAHSYGSLISALQKIKAECLFVSYESDWRYPSSEMEQMNHILKSLGKSSTHIELKNVLGHGAFLYDTSDLAPVLKHFIDVKEEVLLPV